MLRAFQATATSPKEVVKQCTNGNNVVSVTDYFRFWGVMGSKQDEATKFLVELLNKAQDIEKNGAKKVKAGKDMEHVLLLVMNTLKFIDMFYPVKSDLQAFQKALRSYDTFRHENKTYEFYASPDIHQVVNHLLKRWLSNSETIEAFLMDCAYVNGASTSSLMMSAATGGGVSRTTQRPAKMTPPNAFGVLRDNPFALLRLLSAAETGGEEASKIFLITIRFLQSIPPLIRAQPSTSGLLLGNATSLMLFMRAFLSVKPVLDASVLQHARFVTQQFENWPLPYGLYASQTSKILWTELKSPGALLRRRMETYHPLLGQFGAKQATEYGATAVEWSRACRSVVIMIDEEVPRADLLVASIGNAVSKGSGLNDEMRQLKASMLAHILETHLESPNSQRGWRSNIVASVESMPEEKLDELYHRARAAISVYPFRDRDLLSVASQVSGKNLRARSPSVLVDKLSSAATMSSSSSSSSSPSKGSPARYPPTQSSSSSRSSKASFTSMMQSASSVLQSSSLNSNSIGSAAAGSGGSAGASGSSLGIASQSAPSPVKELWSTIIPFSPLLGLDFQEIGRPSNSRGGSRSYQSVRKSRGFTSDITTESPAWASNGEDGAGTGVHAGPRHYVEYAVDYDQFIRDAIGILPPALSKDDDAETANNVLRQYRPVMRRVALGSHAVLHRLVCSYVALQNLEPWLCAKIDFQFFIAPLGRNDIASYLAMKDGWYRRHVFAPFHGPLPLIPEIRLNVGDTLSLGDSVDFDSRERSRARTSMERERAPTEGVGGGGGSTQASGAPSGDDSGSGARVFANAGIGGAGEGAGHNLNATPVKLLRDLMTNFTSLAQNRMSLNIFDCECWFEATALEANPAALRRPDLTIPFVTRAEFGLGAYIAKEGNDTEFRTNFSGELAVDGLGPQPTLLELLEDKTFFKKFASTPELNVTLLPVVDDDHGQGNAAPNADGTPRHQPESADAEEEEHVKFGEGSFLSLSVSNVPRYSFPSKTNKGIVREEPYEPSSSCANPRSSSLEVISLRNTSGNLEELIKRRDKKDRDLKNILDQLRLHSKVHAAGGVDIRCSQATPMPFTVALDDQIYGPFYRVRIRPCKARIDTPDHTYPNAPHLQLPVMTFLPCND